MSNNDSGSGGSGLSPREKVFYIYGAIYVFSLGAIQLKLGLLTRSANIATGLVFVATVSIAIMIRLRGYKIGEWVFIVFGKKPIALTQQKVGSWKRNWQVRARNPFQQTPLDTLSAVLHWTGRQLVNLSSLVVSLPGKAVVLITKLVEAIQTDEDSTQTTDTDTEDPDE